MSFTRTLSFLTPENSTIWTLLAEFLRIFSNSSVVTDGSGVAATADLGSVVWVRSSGVRKEVLERNVRRVEGGAALGCRLMVCEFFDCGFEGRL